MHKRYPYDLAHKPQQPNADLDARNKSSGRIAICVAVVNDAAIEQAIADMIKPHLLVIRHA